MAEVTSCGECGAEFGIFFNRSTATFEYAGKSEETCPTCKRQICSQCTKNKLSHPSYKKARVVVCGRCFKTTLLAREGQTTETCHGPVSNRFMLKVAYSLMGLFTEVEPGKPIKVKRDGFVLKHMPVAAAGTKDGWTSEDFTVRVADGFSVTVRWYHPESLDKAGATKHAGAVYFHGGGWCIGTVFQSDQDENYRSMCKTLNMMWFAVEYRLAPEHPFPTPFEDCYAVTQYIMNHAVQFCLDASKVLTIGDSAGANMAAGVAIAAIERGGKVPSYIASINPLMDLVRYDQFPTWPKMIEYMPPNAIPAMVLAYCPNHTDRSDPRASPPYSKQETLKQLPPVMVMSAGYDSLRGDAEAWSNILRAAGARVTDTYFSTSWHGFFPRFGEGDEAAAQLAFIVRRHFGLDGGNE